MALSARWKNHIEEWQASGLSQTEYCRQPGLYANTFSGRLSHCSVCAPSPPFGLLQNENCCLTG